MSRLDGKRALISGEDRRCDYLWLIDLDLHLDGVNEPLTQVTG